MAKFKFIHVADTHNGHSGNASRYNEYSSLRVHKTTDKGINIREDDIDKAFEQVIDLAIEHNVDAVLHAGDGTDFWGYRQPRVLNFYLGQVARLNPQGIKYIEIVGNHNLPKKSGVGCYLETLGKLPGVRTVYHGFYELVDDFIDGVAIHCTPSTFTQELLDEAIGQVTPIDGKINIGMGHYGVTSIKHYAENAINTLVVDLDRLIKCNMDYFALGDYHATTDFGHNIWYSGSIERMGFGEIANKPKVLLVEIDYDTKEVNVTELPLNVRPMIEVPTLDAKGKEIEEINTEIVSRLSKVDMKDKIVRFRVKNLPVHLKGLIDDRSIKELTEEALYFKIELVDKVSETKLVKTAGTKFEGVLEGWSTFADSIAEDGTFDKEELKREGYERLVEVYDNAIG